jgi:hypothetical protein
MKRNSLFGVVLGLLLPCCISATAQELGPWRAVNSPAVSITGDVAFSDAKIAIDFSSFPIARIRDLQPGEVSAVFDADSSAGARGSLYRLSIPASKKFMHRNSICGTENTQWVAAFVAGRNLHLAFFSGQKMPVFTPEAISNSTDLCGTFLYGR